MGGRREYEIWLEAGKNYEHQLPQPGDLQLGPLRQLLGVCDQPDQAFRTVLVGGTNGKGTTATAMAAALTAAGHRTGLFTSPHFRSWTERIRIDGEPVADDLLDAILTELPERVRDASSATWFERITLLAALAFRRAEVRFAIVEVGLGGRLDATNALSRELQVLTSVQRDHCHLLGTRIPRIAEEKAGIIQPEIPTVSGHLSQAAAAVIRRTSVRRRSPLYEAGIDWGATVGRKRTVVHLPRGGVLAFRPRIAGRRQRENLALVGAAFDVWERRGGPPMPGSLLADLFGRFEMPGRCQRVNYGDRTLILDVAHNPSALTQLVQSTDVGSADLLFGAMQDKELDRMARALSGVGGTVHLVPVAHPRGADVETLKAAFGDREVRCHPSMAAALESVLSGTGTILATGSHRVVAEIAEHLEIDVV